MTHGNQPPTRGERVLFFGKSMSRTRCTGALVDAWESTGAEVRWINMAKVRRWLGRGMARDHARRVFRRFEPDLVFVFCRDLPLNLLREFRATVPVVLWVEEALEDLNPPSIEYFRNADLVCLSNPGRIPLLQEAGVGRTEFLMSGFSPRYHRPLPSAKVRNGYERDIAFIGGPGRRGQRAELLDRLSREFDTEVFGLHWDDVARSFPNLSVRGAVNNKTYARVCATSRIVLGINEINEDRGYFSNRTWLTLGCRGFHLTHYVPGLEQVFENHRHLVWFRRQEEVSDLVRRYLDDEAAREEIRAAGHNLAMDRHQYRHRIERVRELLPALGARPRPGTVVLQPSRAHEASEFARSVTPASVRGE